MHTKDRLAEALEKAGCHAAAELAARGYYDDYLSPLALPAMQLVKDLSKIDTPEARAIIERVKDGDFDATAEEADAWARSVDGQQAPGRLISDATGPDLEAAFAEFVAACWPGLALHQDQLRDVRKTFFGGALVMFNVFAVEYSEHGGIRGGLIAMLAAKLQALDAEFTGAMQ